LHANRICCASAHRLDRSIRHVNERQISLRTRNSWLSRSACCALQKIYRLRYGGPCRRSPGESVQHYKVMNGSVVPSSYGFDSRFDQLAAICFTFIAQHVILGGYDQGARQALELLDRCHQRGQTVWTNYNSCDQIGWLFADRPVSGIHGCLRSCEPNTKLNAEPEWRLEHSFLDGASGYSDPGSGAFSVDPGTGDVTGSITLTTEANDPGTFDVSGTVDGNTGAFSLSFAGICAADDTEVTATLSGTVSGSGISGDWTESAFGRVVRGGQRNFRRHKFSLGLVSQRCSQSAARWQVTFRPGVYARNSSAARSPPVTRNNRPCPEP
jgi:hypothetical protein